MTSPSVSSLFISIFYYLMFSWFYIKAFSELFPFIWFSSLPNPFLSYPLYMLYIHIPANSGLHGEGLLSHHALCHLEPSSVSSDRAWHIITNVTKVVMTHCVTMHSMAHSLSALWRTQYGSSSPMSPKWLWRTA